MSGGLRRLASRRGGSLNTDEHELAEPARIAPMRRRLSTRSTKTMFLGLRVESAMHRNLIPTFP